MRSMDPRAQALAELDGLLGQAQSRARPAQLDATGCMRLVELVALVPGRLRRVAEVLARQYTSASVDALLELGPSVPGVVEGIHRAIGRGVVRDRIDGSTCTPMLALDFPHPRVRDAPELVARARTVFGPAFDRLEVRGRTYYRFMLRAGRGTLAGRAAATAHDFHYLHRRLAPLKGTRLWLNGWCFPAEGRFGTGVRIHLARAWLSWAAGQTHTTS
jgi:hypothetical protein